MYHSICMFPQTVPTHVTWSRQQHVLGLKGQCHKIFCFGFFRESSSPKPLKIILGSFQIFSKILGDIRKSSCTTGSTTGGKLPTVSTTQVANNWNSIRQLKVNLKEIIYLYVNSTTQRCPNKRIKTFLIVDFFHLLLSTTTVVHIELQISQRILRKKIKTTVMGYSGSWGKLIHEKNLKSTISWPYPLNVP